jgi:hypothetical protein
MPQQARRVRRPSTKSRSEEIPEAVNPDYSEIARLAYLHWLDRGCPNGSPEEDWARAERDLRNNQNQTA